MIDEDENNRSQTPLAGVVTCCTSISPEERSSISALVSSLGGLNKLDLTSDVTHLLVGAASTPKYKYVAASRPDVLVLLPSFLAALREEWLQGEHVDVSALEQQHACPPFWGLRVCLTGFNDPEERRGLEKVVRDNGGEYRADLTKEVTHLVAKRPEGAKYTHAKVWGVSVVGVQWLERSLERGLALEESFFDPNLPEEEMGNGAWVRELPGGAGAGAGGKRARENQDGEKEGASGKPPRKLRRTASGRWGSQKEEGEKIWGDIVGGGFEKKSEVKGEWEEGGEQRSHTETGMEESSPVALPTMPKPANSAAVRKPVSKQGLFHGKRFFLHGFKTKQSALLEQHLRSQDAELLPEMSQLSQPDIPSSAASSFLLVPHTSSDHEVPFMLDQESRTVVNELWIEKIITTKTFVNPSTNPAYGTFHYPIDGFDKMTISSTGFVDVELLHIGKTVRLLGAKYAGTLDKSASALVCHNDASPNREKVLFALKQNLPVVKAEWLWDCMRTGDSKSMFDYLLHPEKQRHLVPSPDLDLAPKQEPATTLQQTSAGYKKPIRSYGKLNGKGSWLRRKGEKENAAQKPTPENSIQHQVEVGDNLHILDVATDDNSNNSIHSGTIDLAADGDSSTTLIALPAALTERSANSPPKYVSLSLKDLPNPAVTKPSHTEPDSLSTAITSLLAARRAESTTPTAVDTGTGAGAGSTRRRRSLLGRAASNLSNKNSLSRASSVDTLNTDGVGTPVETGPLLSAGGSTKGLDPLVEALFGNAGERQDGEEGEDLPVGTQVGYVEAEAEAWRDKVAREKGWGRREGAEKAKGRAAGRSLLVDTAAGDSVARRTRHHAGR